MVKGPAVAVLLFMVVSLSGCLGDDIWREPYRWSEPIEMGENQDAAQAFAAGFQSLGQQAQDEGRDQVVETSDDLPDSVVFQNARQFLNDQQSGSGDDFDRNVRVATSNASDAYVQLTGPAAAAYQAGTGPIFGTPTPLTFQVADRTTRVRWSLDVLLTGEEAPEEGQNPTPVGAVQVTIYDGRGAIRAQYDIDTTRALVDQVIEGTFGDRGEVRSHLGGQWRVEVDANAEGAWSLVVEAYEPEYDDYEWWQFWRAERRPGSGS